MSFARSSFFASGPATSKYPTLWKGLIRLVNHDAIRQGPFDKVFDLSLLKKHGTYTAGNGAANTAYAQRGRVFSQPSGFNVPGASFENFTINAWVRFNTVSSFQWLFASRLATTPYFYVALNGTTEIIFLLASSGGQSYYQSTHGMVAGRWYLISLVKRGGVLECYIDGKLKPLTASATQTASVDFSADVIFFGRENRNTSSQLDGLIGECSVYNRALHPNEIRLMAFQNASPLTPRRSYYGKSVSAVTIKPWLYSRRAAVSRPYLQVV